MSKSFVVMTMNDMYVVPVSEPKKLLDLVTNCLHGAMDTNSKVAANHIIEDDLSDFKGLGGVHFKSVHWKLIASGKADFNREYQVATAQGKCLTVEVYLADQR